MLDTTALHYLSFHSEALQRFEQAGKSVTHHHYGFPLELRPGVYPSSPELSYSTQMAIDQLPQKLSGCDVLDVGTGPGPIALAAAYRGARVIACDHHDQAVGLARANVVRNGFGGQITVIKSHLFDGVKREFPGQRFDFVAANLWFPPQQCRESKYTNKYHVCHRQFLSNVRDVLKPNGVAILTSNACADIDSTRQMFGETGIEPTFRSTLKACNEGKLPVEWHAYLFNRDGKPPRPS